MFGRCYNLATVGLRYFNVFGARQDPEGAYAAVIPRWVASMLAGQPCVINGDGQTSRDFCYVANAVQANLCAALVDDPNAVGQVYNVAAGQRTTLLELHDLLAAALRERRPGLRWPRRRLQTSARATFATRWPTSQGPCPAGLRADPRRVRRPA